MANPWPPTHLPQELAAAAAPTAGAVLADTQRRPEPGSRGAAKLAWLCAAVLLFAVVVLQQSIGSGSAAGQAPAAGSGATAVVDAADDDPNLIIAKIFVRINAALKESGAASGPGPDPMEPFVDQLRQGARTHASRLRLAPILGETRGAESALGQLDELEKDLPADSPLRADAAAFRAVYEGSAPPDAGAMKGLVDRHGYFGRVAETFGTGPADPFRVKAREQGSTLIVVFVALGLVVLVGLLTGFGLFITALVMMATRSLRLRHVPAAAGGSLGIEMVAVFFLGFLVLKASSMWVASFAGRDTVVWFSLCAQWGLLAIFAWPFARGMPWGEARASLGLHSGRGIVREMAAGLVGYLACIPILLLGAITTLVALLVREAVRKAMNLPDAGPPTNPILELLAGTNGVQLVLLIALAVVWAPLVEETVFRGGLFRHLTGYMPWVAAGLVSALVFALGHAYDALLLFPVMALGIGFAIIRQWRGSLIASMTAHAIHNAFVMTLTLAVFSQLGD
ncbi:MAG: lysostaphin resistance A-like protein [Phycisphaerales bacterium]